MAEYERRPREAGLGADITNQAQRQTEVMREFTRLKGTRNALAEAISLLEKRVAPALRAPQPTPGDSCEREQPPSSPLAGALAELTREFMALRETLEAIVERIEL
jgi:hypothetical protein